MNAYLYRAALLCDDCGKAAKIARREYEGCEDSDHFPQGPVADGGGEADSPQHCDECGLFLCNPLTPDGDAYVRAQAAPYDAPDSSWDEIAARAALDGKAALAEWITHYLAWGQ